MNALDLRAEVFSTLNPYLDDEDVLKSILDYLKSLVSKKETVPVAEHDTDEEIVANRRQSFKVFKDYKDGKAKLKSADVFLKEFIFVAKINNATTMGIYLNPSNAGFRETLAGRIWHLSIFFQTC